jgi:acyl carrier protein
MPRGTRLDNQTKNEAYQDGSGRLVTRQALEAAVYRAIDLLNETLAASQQVAKSPHTILGNRGGRLDSMALVNLMVFVEDAIFSELGREVDLIGAERLRPEDLKTVETLIDALARILSD